MNVISIAAFRRTVWGFYQKNQRDFPWRRTQNPYYILVSEVMLQQTQADRVVRYYERFIDRFPDFASLASASFAELYSYWNGLGYNRRALFLQKAAQKAVAEFGGKLPETPELLETFPGIGIYTARAVSTFSFDIPQAFIETNIRRVFLHHFFKGKTGIIDSQILVIAERALDKKRSREWHWALMDYGSYLKTVVKNPNRRHKQYAVQSKFEGSLRQVRGMILRMLSGKAMNMPELVQRTKKPRTKLENVVSQLEKEGFLRYNSNKKVYQLA